MTFAHSLALAHSILRTLSFSLSLDALYPALSTAAALHRKSRKQVSPSDLIKREEPGEQALLLLLDFMRLLRDRGAENKVLDLLHQGRVLALELVVHLLPRSLNKGDYDIRSVRVKYMPLCGVIVSKDIQHTQI